MTMREKLEKLAGILSEERANVEAQQAAGADLTEMVSISGGNKKMGAVPSISTLPVFTCPGVCMGTCGKDCYALKLANLRPAVAKAWARNTAVSLVCPSAYFKAVENAVKNVRFFRWHVSGDIRSSEYFAEMVRISVENPGVQFLAFTKRFYVVNEWIDKNGSLPENLRIMFSGWDGLTPENPHNLPETIVYKKDVDIHPDWLLCGGNCLNCGCRGVGCWQAKAGETIAFKKH